MEREISIILKVKGADAAKKAVQDVFNQQTTTLVKGFNQATAKTATNMGKVAKNTKQASTATNTFTKSLGRGMAALYLYQRAWNTFGMQFEEGLQLQRASTQFERHVGNVSKMLPELRSATMGVVSDFDLLKTAQRAFQQGLKPQNITTAFKLGTSAAQKLGLNTSEAINTITNAMTKQDEGALNTLGIVTKVNQAYQTQTALIAKNGGVMSKAMGIQIRQSLIMKELQNRFGGANKAQEDGLAILERFRASWKNFRATIGETLGLALIPLTRALTGVLDTVTSLLSKLNQTGGFQKFVQIAGTLAVVWGSVKFIQGARTLLSLVGVFGGTGGIKATRTFQVLSKSASFLGGVVGALTKRWNNFVVALSFVAPRLASIMSSIPGIGIAITAVTVLFKPLLTFFGKVWTAAKVFFQLLSNFDENSGLSKVLRKDAEALGSAYNLIENVAKIALESWAMLKGLGQGLYETFAPVGQVLGWVTDKVEEFGGWLFQVDKIAVRSSSRLDAITEKWKRWAKYIGLAASGIAMLIPGLQVAGGLGVAGFGASILNDMGIGGDALAAKFSGGQTQPSPSSVQAEPQISTQQTTPTPRAMNLDYSDDSTELLRKMNKVLEKQTGIMETDSQKQEIQKSQQNARDNIWTRR